MNPRSFRNVFLRSGRGTGVVAEIGLQFLRHEENRRLRSPHHLRHHKQCPHAQKHDSEAQQQQILLASCQYVNRKFGTSHDNWHTIIVAREN